MAYLPNMDTYQAARFLGHLDIMVSLAEEQGKKTVSVEEIRKAANTVTGQNQQQNPPAGFKGGENIV